MRPIVESNCQIWNPFLIKDINTIEAVQRKFTKFLPGLFNDSYQTRLSRLGLESLEIRRIKADLTLLYKIINNLVDIDASLFFFSFNCNNTRGARHGFKINIQHSRLNCHKYFLKFSLLIELLQFGLCYQKPLCQNLIFLNLKRH